MGRLLRKVTRREEGQALVLFSLGLVVFMGFVAMSIDVGRLVWARTSIQGAVDSAALAAAGGMPSTTTATANANQYWLDNSSFIRNQGQNVQFNVSFPAGTNRGVEVHAEADIPTWFAKFFGISKWRVSADGSAASQYLDLAIVLDISGSMCFDSYPETEPLGTNLRMSPGRTANIPRLVSPILASTGNSITIALNSVAMFNNTNAGTNRTNFGSWFNTTTRYWQYSAGGAFRAGMIRIDNELFKITGLNATARTLTVTRAQTNLYTGTATAKASHLINAEVWANRSECFTASRNTPTSTVLGPNQRYDETIADAKYFVSLFNSSWDRFGVTSFTTTADPRGAGTRVALTNNYSTVNNAFNAMAYPDGGTNTALGIASGRQLLNGSGARADATRVVLLITDGRANTYCGSSYNPANYNNLSCPGLGSGGDGNSSAVNAALQEATRLANDKNTTIYVIGLGTTVDDSFLQQIADIGKGQYFKAPSLTQIQAAFVAVAQQTHISLTR